MLAAVSDAWGINSMVNKGQYGRNV